MLPSHVYAYDNNDDNKNREACDFISLLVNIYIAAELYRCNEARDVTLDIPHIP